MRRFSVRNVSAAFGGASYRVLLLLALAIAGCCHRRGSSTAPLDPRISPEEHQELMQHVPMYRDLVNGKVADYKTETEQFFDRVQRKHSAKELQDWALRIVELNKEKTEPFDIPPKDLPEFIADLDPPTKPWAVVYPRESVTIDWGGGFGHWGLHIGPSSFRPTNPIQYVIEWAPGVYVYRSKT